MDSVIDKHEIDSQLKLVILADFLFVESEAGERLSEHCLRIVAAPELAVYEVESIYRFLPGGLARHEIHRLGKSRDIRFLHALAVIHAPDIYLYVYSLRHRLLHRVYLPRDIVSVIFVGHVVMIFLLPARETDVPHGRHGKIFGLIGIYRVGMGVSREFLEGLLHIKTDGRKLFPTVVDHYQVVCPRVKSYHR